MTIAEQLANRLREVILNGTWFANTNFKDQLQDLDWNLAVRTLGSTNSISILAQHVHYYLQGVLNVWVNGKLEIRDAYSFDFPPMSSQTQWTTFQERFWQDTERLASFIERMTDEQLGENFVDEKYGSYLRNINGMIEHGYYHLGQIVLLKKMIDPSSEKPKFKNDV